MLSVLVEVSVSGPPATVKMPVLLPPGDSEPLLVNAPVTVPVPEAAPALVTAPTSDPLMMSVEPLAALTPPVRVPPVAILSVPPLPAVEAAAVV